MKHIILSLSALSFLLFASCSSVNTVERAEPLATPDPIAIKKVITDPALKDKADVVNVIQGTVSDDLLKIQVQVENLTYDYQDFNYQFVWIDKNGFQVTSPTPIWRPVQIAGRQTKYLTAIAPNPNVVDFQVNLLSRETYNNTVGAGKTGPAGKR